jgi:predicted DNA-binding protein (UPF0251 family)
MNATNNDRRESALYWTAVSLIVCEGLPVREAARRLGVQRDQLRQLLRERTAAYLVSAAALSVEAGDAVQTRH